MLTYNPDESYWGGIKFLQNNHLTYVNNSNQIINPIYKQFSYSEIPGNVTSDAFCDAKDSLYGSFSEHAMVPINDNFKWDEIRPNAYSLNGNAELKISSLQILESTLCKKISICDTIKIHGPSSSCLNDDTITFHVYKNPTCFKKIEWQIDTSIVSIAQNPNDTSLVLRLKKTGVFTLYANLENCVVKDSIQITINEPEIAFSIIKDSLLCPGKTLLLKSTEGFASYTWQNNSDASSLIVSQPGLYKVIAIDGCGNIFKDSVLVRLIDTSFALQNNNNICLKDTLRIDLPTGFTNISWYPINSGFVQNNQLLLFPEQTSEYEIIATLPGDCDIKKETNIQVNVCPETIYFPNAFTPNNDGLNDMFKPILGMSLKYYQLTIFNRFGQKIFSSKNPSNGWDGKYLNYPQNAGVFVWQCIYQFNNKEIKKIKGSVLLLR